MAFVEPVTLSARGITLLPLALEHEAGLRLAAADGELWKLRVTSVPEPGQTRDYIDTALRMGFTAAWPVLPVLLLVQTVHAITFATHHTVCIALLSKHFPGRLRGRGQALFAVLGYGLPGVIGGVFGGMLSGTLLAVFFVPVFFVVVIGTQQRFNAWRKQHIT